MLSMLVSRMLVSAGSTGGAATEAIAMLREVDHDLDIGRKCRAECSHAVSMNSLIM